ncbi:hypothetical protein [Litoribrevibacter albus]|uniref:Uncharacterized protein n=1 Tax=Litoribrevibacter albus TaxID=1473156 RepID=A0AA37S8I3_9GAMM|nr:hypothetical protein [Litoribrevibacter albus]GLQ30169.1 hypothetical protein GCM10007876_06470 [Litoribrevibacter albus]
MSKNKGAKKKSPNAMTKTVIKARNPFALDPLMKKGGAHDKTVKAKRKSSKNLLRKQLAELSRSFLKFF